MSEPVVTVNNFSYRYNQTKTRALKNLTFQVEAGSFFCIVGGNGSGKSTLCNALVGLIPHYFVGKKAGEIIIDGLKTEAATIAELSTRIGLVFQNPFNQLSYTAGTVAEELAYGLGNRGVPRTEMLKKVETVSKLMHIDHILSKNPLELSGGQVQRVAFGSTFILEPKILVLDECTTQLDPMGSDEIFAIVKRLNQNGITVIMVDHDMERVAKNADQIMVLSEGEIQMIGNPKDVFEFLEQTDLGIEVPDYVKISRILQQKGYTKAEITWTEEETIRLVKEALKHEDPVEKPSF
ncbi:MULTISPECIES: energy-coupling factor ABC transporter ATP-binding protein [unclassified Enterococcus]|uniref:energy-coupling factor ABC transporter ATP-binding protein n=1 Tax=unclassified Enterococcus TaxID=2608891 RepID=UPI001CE1DFA2|nr:MULTISPECIES: ATP-binding cassette domain-containing protein [unclassified Enterococcus]MCA5011801.1 ATP-binding cassette domain-containing protein [Enterococcus sp. S23]MCA5014757.1 ATP-binding cassette domain-containing protein [Enterococcus sp. S22(2020)]